MLTSKSFRDQVKNLYQFFVNAELTNGEVTYNQIQERLVDRKYDTLVWYANNFWTWFLSKKEKRGRYQIFVCQGLTHYPEEFFVEAHLNKRGKYFYHFGRALDASSERARLRKQFREQAGLPPPDQEPPAEAEQDFPEELHFADNADSEVEDLDEDPLLENTALIVAPPSVVPSMQRSALRMTPGERIREMFDFSRKNREALDQLHQAIETLSRTLATGQGQLSNELVAVTRTLGEHGQKITQSLAEIAQLRTTVAGQGQFVRDDLARGIEGLTQQVRQGQTPQGDLARRIEGLTLEVRQGRAAREEFTRQLDTVAQEVRQGQLAGEEIVQKLEGLTQEVRLRQVTREEFTREVEELAQQVQQGLRPPDLSPIYAALATQAETLHNALKQLPTSPDLVSIRDTLVEGIKQPDTLPGLSQMATDLATVQEQISQLFSLLSQKAERHAPTSTNGLAARPLRATIEAAARVRKAIERLEETYLEWLRWLEWLDKQLQGMQHGHVETKQWLQTTQQSYEELTSQLQTIRVSISSVADGQQEQKDEVAQERGANSNDEQDTENAG